MAITDLVGYAAGLGVLATFWTKSAVRMRTFALLSNMLFVIYGATLRLDPVVILHAILLPINAVRLAELHGITATISVRLSRLSKRRSGSGPPLRRRNGDRLRAE